MTEQRRQMLRELRSCLMISFGIAIAFHLGAPAMVAPKDLRYLLISGCSFGFGFFAVGLLIPKTRFRSFALTMVARSLLFLVTILLCMTILVWTGITITSGASPFDLRVWKTLADVFLNPLMAVSIPLCFLLAAGINAFFQINQKLGPGILKNWVFGKYHEPREEERIFMFLDLKNSTPLAERLGNIRFSRLVRDFFQDLTYPVLETKGEVSHYIGDEAVLSWKPTRGLPKANCIRCFFLFDKAIGKRADHYMKEYGIVPEFKAGMHIGLVVATDVGEIKSEIVFHGDVVNTTARITGLCAEMRSDLLISAELLRRLELPEDLKATNLGAKLLKGKEKEVEVFSVVRSAEVGSDYDARMGISQPTPIAK